MKNYSEHYNSDHKPNILKHIKIQCNPEYSTRSNSLQLFINIYLLPVVSLIGFFLNVICVLVYRKILRKKPEILYKYLYINSISNSLAMFIDMFAPMALCGNDCKISQTYSAQFFYLYGFIYLADVFETFSSLIDIILTIDRYDQLTNKLRFLRKVSYKLIILFLFLISLIYYIPFILKKKIVQLSYPENEKCFNTSEEVYILAQSNFGKSKFGIYFILIQLILSEVFVLCIMIIFNVLLLISLNRHIYLTSIENKRLYSRVLFSIREMADGNISMEDDCLIRNSISLQNQNRSNFRLTLMIISMSILNLFGNSPIVILYTIGIFYSIDPVLNNNLVALSNLLAVFTFTCYIFVYYYFNNLFRASLKNMMLFKNLRIKLNF
ncbi:unnamed protein product [Brachionus calyciflorus]|uniref:G-protein coupled receptors family 1 profile domain-containing protein n=1 Tax=Brachionus calyciflorus TaxID=104777 RepID=A0A814GQV9_9BILA|nr:unnamed protein product [Brachionus calyciflorus]